MDFSNYIFIQHLNNGFVKEEKETIGYLSYIPKFGKAFNCFTVELPWRNNEVDVSRIMAGVYKYEKAWSKKHKMVVIRLLDVEGRTDVEIHIANFVSDLLGCIGVGMYRSDINGDGVIDVANSAKAFKALMKIIPDKGFIKIVDL